VKHSHRGDGEADLDAVECGSELPRSTAQDAKSPRRRTGAGFRDSI